MTQEKLQKAKQLEGELENLQGFEYGMSKFKEIRAQLSAGKINS